MTKTMSRPRRVYRGWSSTGRTVRGADLDFRVTFVTPRPIKYLGENGVIPHSQRDPDHLYPGLGVVADDLRAKVVPKDVRLGVPTNPTHPESLGWEWNGQVHFPPGRVPTVA